MQRSEPLPVARKQNLVIQELPDELLVYDLDRDKAHCLNRTAAFVFKHCDGRRSVSTLARLLEQELKTPVEEAVVRMSLDRLAKARLLEDWTAQGGRSSRREMLATVGKSAVWILPVVATLIAPRAAQAATCLNIKKGGACTKSQCGMLCASCKGDNHCKAQGMGYMCGAGKISC
jgi:Coenzyme PQQ synthesis protein D (PqqD)